MHKHVVNRHLEILLLLGLTLLAFAFRVYRLDYQSLWYDEGFSVHLAGQSLATITAGELNLPLYHYLLHFWLPLAGPSSPCASSPLCSACSWCPSSPGWWATTCLSIGQTGRGDKGIGRSGAVEVPIT